MEELRKAMRAVQDSARYEHTLGVAYTAACLASLYGEDTKKAMRAGLLHDCAKCIDSKEKLFLCEKYGLEVNAFERRNPSLVHAKLGAKLAEVTYDVADEDILNAIRYHTTGRPCMSLLEKIIFTADYIEPGRTKASHLTQIRQLAFSDLDKAVVMILQNTLAYLERCQEEIDPATRETLAYYTQLTGIHEVEE